MNKEQEELLGAAYNNYIYNPDYKAEGVADLMGSQAGQLVKCPTQEDFITECKTDSKFSKKWGLKIEEKLLDLNERQSWLFENKRMFLNNEFCDEVESHKNFDYYNIPKKLITITYNDKTIESYE